MALLIKAAALFAAVTLAAPVVPQSNPVPVDLIARAKFPKATPKEIDALALVNRTVNEAMISTSDQEHYGVPDLWVMAPADMKGDCEDYALTKLYILQRAGFPIVTNTKLVGVIVHNIRKGRDDSEGHAILAVLLNSGDVVYLDNLNEEPMSRAELVAKGYQFFDWKA